MNEILIGFDLETSGVSKVKDRPVQACMVQRSHVGDRVLLNTRVNPGIPIDPEATAIHGISDSDVKYAPDYFMVAWMIASISRVQSKSEKQAVLVTFNGYVFDVPMINNCLGKDVIQLPHIDVLRFARHHFPDVRGSKGGKSLGELYEIFIGRSLEDAHDAAVDVIATLDVFQALLKVESMSIEDLCIEQSQPKPYDIMPTGKYIGLPISEIPSSWANFMNKQPDLDPDLRCTVSKILKGGRS